MVGLGVLLHAIGGFAAGSFYIPFKKVRNWSWESYWLVAGVFSWVIMPWLVALLVMCAVVERPEASSWLAASVLTVRSAGGELLRLLGRAPVGSLAWSYVFGVLWGIGGLTFGLSMRYLGMSLGYAIALGFCAAFGTLIPPIFSGEFVGLLTSVSGLVTLSGVLACLVGIAICGRAGMAKERQLSAEQKQATIKEFNFSKGLLVAIFAGVMSSCMSFGITAGAPIAAVSVDAGVPKLWENSAVLVVVLAGGFTTNVLWCVILNIKNRSGRDYIRAEKASLAGNYLFSALAGVTWYFQFMFFGMGKTKMGRYDFSSWTLHMAFIIVFSNIWGLLFREWKGSSRRTLGIVVVGIMVVVLSVVLIGTGNYLASPAE